ncbi:MAG: hypothetical protein KDD60_07055, partial [Bdellovibrionales bacterium]|nr:hypothetical protein [Bdellovibrionales bacterium]
LSNSHRLNFVCYLTNVFTVGLASSCGTVALFLALVILVKSRTLAAALALSYALATIAFPYSTLFFSHQFTAGLLIISFTTLLYLRGKRTESVSPKAQLRILYGFAGFCAGYAFVCEYPALIVTATLSLYTLLTRPRRMELILYCSGILLGMLPLVLYNSIVFGNWHFLTYGVESQVNNPSYHYHKVGFLGLQMLSLKNVLALTIMPFRGLFYCNPWLVLSVGGPFLLIRKQGFQLEHGISLAIALTLLCFNAGLTFWDGGSGIGPRYLLLAIPFLVILIAPCIELSSVYRVLIAPLILPSAIFMYIASAVDPMPQITYRNPIFDLLIPLYQQGKLAMQSWGVFEHELITHNSVAFNLGKLLGLSPQWQLMPLLAMTLLLSHFMLQISYTVDKQNGLKPIPPLLITSCAAIVPILLLVIS